MAIPHTLVRAARNAIETSAILKDPAVMRGPNRPQLRRCRIAALGAQGQIIEHTHITPALPLFEQAFCAFSRGSLLETESGPMAIEDILPGERVVTRDGAVLPVVWKGSTQVLPERPEDSGRGCTLIRVMADSFGIGRPMSGIVAGPAARLLRTPGHLHRILGRVPALTPLREFIDGLSVIEIAPPTPVELYHLCLERHAVIRVSGLEFETYHPGVNALRTTGKAMKSLFLGLFPHISDPADFGPLACSRADDAMPEPRTA